MVDVLLIKYDIYYTEPATTQLGFMLAKNTRGVKHWERYDRVGTPPIFAVGDVTEHPIPKEAKDAIYGRLRLGQLFDGSGLPTTIDEKIKDIVIPFDSVRNLHSLTLYTIGSSATIYFTVSYSIDGGYSFSNLGDFKTSPSTEVNFAANTVTSAVILRFTVTAVTDGQAAKLVNFALKSVATKPAVATFVHTVKCADNILLKKNLQSNSTIAAYVTFLGLMRNKICTLGDRDGVEHNVMVRIVHEIEVLDEETKRPARNFTIEATEV